MLLWLKAGGNLERNDFGRKLDESGRRAGRSRQAVQIMIGDCNDGGRGIVYDIADWRYCSALEGTIKVPMLKPMRITCDDRGFIAMYVISVIAVTVRIVIFVVVFVIVMVRFIRGIVVMDVRMVSSAVPMMNYAHDARRTPDPCLSIRDFRLDPTIPTRQIVQTVSCGKVSPLLFHGVSGAPVSRLAATQRIHSTVSFVSANSFFSESQAKAAARANFPARIDITM